MPFLYNFSTTRNFALRDRGLLSTSSGDAVTGLEVKIRTLALCPQVQTGCSGGQRQFVLSRLKACFTNRSSSEWKLMTARRPYSFKSAIRLGIACSIVLSSSFTAMRSA